MYPQPSELSSLPPKIPSPYVGFTFPGQDPRPIFILPLSLETELSVLEYLKTIVEEQVVTRLHIPLTCFQLGYYLTTLEEDILRRSHMTPYSNDWNACNVLIGEKEVCSLSFCPSHMYVSVIDLPLLSSFLSNMQGSYDRDDQRCV